MSDTQAPAEGIFAHLLQMVEGMARGFAHIADTVPQASGLAALVKTMKTDAVKLREMVIPPPPEPEAAVRDPQLDEPKSAIGGEPGGIVGPLGSEVPAPESEDPADHSADDLNHQELAEIEATQTRSADGRFSS